MRGPPSESLCAWRSPVASATLNGSSGASEASREGRGGGKGVGLGRGRRRSQGPRALREHDGRPYLGSGLLRDIPRHHIWGQAQLGQAFWGTSSDTISGVRPSGGHPQTSYLSEGSSRAELEELRPIEDLADRRDTAYETLPRAATAIFGV